MSVSYDQVYAAELDWRQAIIELDAANAELTNLQDRLARNDYQHPTDGEFGDRGESEIIRCNSLISRLQIAERKAYHVFDLLNLAFRQGR